MARVLTERQTLERREALWVRNGEERVLGVTATAAMGADGRFLGVLALFTDLSDVRRLEARVALARHLADLGEVSAGAAHEFRNAAAAIDGYADLALRHPERAPEHLKAIRREAQEMSRVTSDFLLFARPDQFAAGGRRVSTASSPPPCARSRARFRRSRWRRRGQFPEVKGSAVLLRRALVNLLRNAVQATPAGRRAEAGAIAVEGRVDGPELALSVEDRGPGVEAGAPREDLHAVLFDEARRRGLRPRHRGTHRRSARRDGRGGRAAGRRLALHLAGAGGVVDGAGSRRGSFGRVATNDLKESLSRARSSASSGATAPDRTSSDSD